MPTIDTFGMPTSPAHVTCPVCGVGALVMCFDKQHGHMNRIACPVPTCAYNVPFKEFRSTLTEVMTSNCPNCGHPVIRKTKDVDSKFMGWVKCSDAGCSYEATFAVFKATTASL